MKKPVCVSPHQYGSISYRSCHNYTFKFKLRRKITHLFPIHQTIPHFSAKINNQPSPSCLQLSLLSSIPVRLADQFSLISVQFAQIHVPPPKYFYDNCCPLLIIIRKLISFAVTFNLRQFTFHSHKFTFLHQNIFMIIAVPC